MADQEQREVIEQEQPARPAYQPPRVERVLTPAELEREILYAGATPASDV